MSLPQLNRRLVLEEPVRLPDGAGGYTAGWRMLGTLWAEIRPGAGREAAGPAGPLALAPLRIILRAAPAGAPDRPQPGQRLREGLRVFAILAVTEADPSGRWLQCAAQEEVAR